MTKQLLGVALSALLFAAAAEAKFEGGFVGADAGYSWQSMKFKSTTTTTKATNKPKGFNVALKAGYSDKVGSVLVGGDVRFGLGFAKDKKDATLNGATAKVEVKNDWTAGLGVTVGTECSSDCLAFVRLGLDYDHYKTNGNSTVAGISSKKFSAWSFAPGIGLKMKVDKDWSVDAMYEYKHAFKTKDASSAVKFDKKPTSHGVKLGVSYYL